MNPNSDPEILFKKFYNQYQNTSTKKNIDFNLSLDEFINLVCKSCYYCGDPPRYYKSIGGIFNGIDRVFNDMGYSDFNCVTSCTTCNFMKFKMEYNDFLQAVLNIYLKNNCEKKACYDFNCSIGNGSKLYEYKKSAERKKRNFLLSDDEFKELRFKRKCFYCDRPAYYNNFRNGIDRVNNKEDYTLKNCVSCCSRCNFMKWTLSIEKFNEKIEKITKKFYPELFTQK